MFRVRWQEVEGRGGIRQRRRRRFVNKRGESRQDRGQSTGRERKAKEKKKKGKRKSRVG